MERSGMVIGVMIGCTVVVIDSLRVRHAKGRDSRM